MCGKQDRFAKWSRHWDGSEHADKWASNFQRKLQRDIERSARRFERAAERMRARYGEQVIDPSEAQKPKDASDAPKFKTDEERRAYERARKRAAAEAGFYMHLMWYGIVIGFLFFVNLLTTGYPWFLWPAQGWGVGLASHFGALYGWRWVHDRVFEPAIQREVQREVTKEKEVLATEKQASLDELTASFAHEIRNPIAAAKSLVQQMGEDPTSNENVEYAKVALDELARVERSVSHLLKYAKEEDYHFDSVNLASVVDAALTQLRGKLEANKVSVSRNYIGGPTVRADADKLRQVFSNIIDNAIDAMESNAAERRLELSIRSGVPGAATVVIRDNGCGIAEDKLQKIFNPFYTTKSSGTGLGMGIAKKVVDSHRGKIDVQSKVGAGTEFSISIPLADAVRNADVEAADSSVPNDVQPMPPRTEELSRNGATKPIPQTDAVLSASTSAESSRVRG